MSMVFQGVTILSSLFGFTPYLQEVLQYSYFFYKVQMLCIQDKLGARAISFNSEK